MGRRIPQKLRRAVETQPEAVLLTVGGASFVAGTLLGSRVGRAVLSAAIPLGLRHLVETELGPRLWSYMADLLRKVEAGSTPA